MIHKTCLFSSFLFSVLLFGLIFFSVYGRGLLSLLLGWIFLLLLSPCRGRCGTARTAMIRYSLGKERNGKGNLGVVRQAIGLGWALEKEM